jgi:hypothetical protein
MLRLPARPEDYIARLVAAADAGIERIAQAVARSDVTVSNGELHLPALTAEALPAGVAEARRALAAKLGFIQLPDLLLDMDVQTRFSKTLLGRSPGSQRELLLTYGALLAHGTERDATGVSKMIPGISAVDISTAMKTLEAEDVIGKANQLLVEFLGRIPLARYWGDGKSASSDMMSVATSRHLWNARLDPRRRTPSIGMYTHVHNQWPIIYNQPIVLGERQVGAAIEGIVRQTEIDIEALAVDTHGYVVIWTPWRRRRRSLSQPICIRVCFRRSGYASHQAAYAERRDVDRVDRRVWNTGRGRERVPRISFRPRLLAEHDRCLRA